MNDALRLVRFVRYAVRRASDMERTGQDATAWRNAIHLTVQALPIILRGNVPPERLLNLRKALDRFPEINGKVKFSHKTIDNQVYCDTIKSGNLQTDGGPGSGNFGHNGRPGKVGGSASGASGAVGKAGGNGSRQAEGSTSQTSQSTEQQGGGNTKSERPEDEQEVLRQFKRYTPGSKSEREKLAQVNPKYDPNDFAWSKNCQRCVVAYELIERGYDVTAKPYDAADSIGNNGMAC